MNSRELATKIVEAVLARLDDHVQHYGLASVDEQLKQAAIDAVERYIAWDREHLI